MAFPLSLLLMCLPIQSNTINDLHYIVYGMTLDDGLLYKLI